MVRDPSFESQKLYLPSQFATLQRNALGLHALGVIEGRLRVAQAHEALDKVRDFLGLKHSMVKAKQKSVRGYTGVTRSEGAIQSTEKLLQRAKATYNRAYTALTSLGVEVGLGTAAGPLQALTDGDLKHLSHWTKDGRHVADQVGWIWKLVGQTGADTTEESWATEGTCKAI